MKLKVQHVYDATLLVARMIRENRPMPTKGRYGLARLHAKLLPEFNTISEQRDQMIRAYDTHVTEKSTDPVSGIVVEIETPAFKVPDEKLAEFAEAWNLEIDVDVAPVPLAHLDLGDGADGVISANEFITLGELVKE
jgi:hypothetical protein